MRPVSDAFLRTLRGSHGFAARVRVVAPGQTGTNPDGTEIPIYDGVVEMNAPADIRSTVDMTTAGRGMWPTRDNPLLLPYGNELFAERGVQFGGGTTEWVSLGYHRIDGSDQDITPDGTVRIEARDRMAGIVDGRLTAPRQFASSATYGGVLAALVQDIYPWATIEWDDATDTTAIGRNLLAEEDRYGFLNEMITSLGKIWHWDHRGVLVVKDLPDPTVPVFGVTHGEGGVLIEAARELSREGVYNGVVAMGSAADTEASVRALAVDNNPASPTYWFGPFGKVPRFYASPFITDVVQAQRAAEAILRKALGLPYTVDLTAVPNPALEPLDAVRVSYGGRYGDETHVLETLTIPLAADVAMTTTTREQTVILIGAA